MKKIIAIGDIHGRDTWKLIRAAHRDADRVIFIGDYFDAPPAKRHWGSDGPAELENFMDIVRYKADYPDKVVLLLGNHDYHYLPKVNSPCSGYQRDMHISFSVALEQAIVNNFMKWIHVEDGYVFSHAGITKTWLKNSGAESLENVNSLNHELFEFTPGEFYDGYGDETCQTPIWVRPNSLLNDKIDGYKQVVGHTQQPNGIGFIEDVCFIDTLHSGHYLAITDGVPSTLKTEGLSVLE